MRLSTDEHTENQPLLLNTDRTEHNVLTTVVTISEIPPDAVVVAEVKSKNKIILKVLSNGANNFLQAGNTIGNSLILKNIGLNAAASLCSSFQSFARNVFSGMLGASGALLSEAKGEGNTKAIREWVLVSYAMTGLLSVISTLLYVIAYFVFPTLYPAITANATCNYIFWTGFGIWPTLGLTMLSQLAFAFDYWKLALFSAIMNRGPAVVGSYFLSNSTSLGVSGVGIANLAAPWVAYIFLEVFMRRLAAFKAAFVTQEGHELDRAELWKKFKQLFILCLKFGFQRCSEWLNLLIITLLIGAKGDTYLEIMNPSLNAIALWSLFSQGIGMAGNQTLSNLKGTLKTQLEKGESYSVIEKTLQEMRSVINISFFAGVATNVVVGIGMYVWRNQLVNFMVNDQASTHDTAVTVLWITALGLIADALRLISASLLNPWHKIMMPNCISLVLMSAIGIPLNYLVAINKSENDAVISMFAIRSTMILLAGIVNTGIVYHTANKEKKDIQERYHIPSEKRVGVRQRLFAFIETPALMIGPSVMRPL